MRQKNNTKNHSRYLQKQRMAASRLTTSPNTIVTYCLAEKKSNNKGLDHPKPSGNLPLLLFLHSKFLSPHALARSKTPYQYPEHMTRINSVKAPAKNTRYTPTPYSKILSKGKGIDSSQRKSSQMIQPCASTTAKILIGS